MDLHVWVCHGKPTTVALMNGPQGKGKGASGDEATEGGAGATREPLPGSPFTVHVSEGSASAAGSFVKDAEAKQASAGANGSFGAGEHIVLRPQARRAHAHSTHTHTLTRPQARRARRHRSNRHTPPAAHSPHMRPQAPARHTSGRRVACWRVAA